MAISVVLFIFVLHLGCSVVHSAFPPKHETVSFETQIERNIEMNNHSAKPNVAETASIICPVGYGCGYQIYNQTTRKTRRFVEYCTCPENSSCVKVGDNLMYHLYYYQCKKDLEDVWMPTHSSTTEPSDVLDSGKLTSDMQDCTEDYMNRAHKPTESTISPRSHKMVQPSDAYLGIYRIYLFVPQNQEQDVESSDQNNNGFTVPTNITPDSVSDSSLDKIAESSVAYPGSKWESSPLQSTPLQNSEEYGVKNDSLFKSSKLSERVIDQDVDTDSNIGQNFASIEPSASNSDSKVVSSLAQKMGNETQTTSFDGSNYSATEMDSGKHNALNSLINKSSSDDDVEVTYEIGAAAGTAVNVQESSLDNSVYNVESTTVEIPLGKIEL